MFLQPYLTAEKSVTIVDVIILRPKCSVESVQHYQYNFKMSAYREEVRDLAGWCQNNNLSLNVTKTKEDYRKRSTEHAHSHRLGCSGAG